MILLFIIAFWLLIEFYSWRHIRIVSRSKTWTRIWSVFHILSLLFVLFTLAYQLFSGSDQYQPGYRENFLVAISMTFVVTKFFACHLFIVSDLVFWYQSRKLKKLAPQDDSQTNVEASIQSRRRFISRLGLMAASVPFVSFLHGFFEGRYLFKVRTTQVYFPDLPEAFDGFRIAQITDVHAGSFDNKEAVKLGLDLVATENPDMILFCGDMVNNFAVEIEPYKDLFKSLEAPYGKFSVLGNHDYGSYSSWPSEEAQRQNLLDLMQHHSDMGFQLLNNSHRRIYKGEESIILAGVENWGEPPFPQRGDLDLTFDGVGENEFSVLMSHDPSHWDARVRDFKKMIHLTLSGHTHGAQMGVEIPGFRFSPSRFVYKQWAGIYQNKKHALYVNRGFGFIGYPGRVGIWPEIAVLELKKGSKRNA